MAGVAADFRGGSVVCRFTHVTCGADTARCGCAAASGAHGSPAETGANIKCRHHIGVGDEAQTVVNHTQQKRCDQIFTDTRGLGSASNMLLGLVAAKVIHLKEMPVVLAMK